GLTMSVNKLHADSARLQLWQEAQGLEWFQSFEKVRLKIVRSFTVRDHRRLCQPGGPVTPGIEQVNHFKARICRSGQDCNRPSRSLSKNPNPSRVQIASRVEVI